MCNIKEDADIVQIQSCYIFVELNNIPWKKMVKRACNILYTEAIRKPCKAIVFYKYLDIRFLCHLIPFYRLLKKFIFCLSLIYLPIKAKTPMHYERL